MDPVSVLLGGLSAIGATIGEKAIKDGYEALKSLLARKFGDSNPRLAERVDDYVQDPDTFAKPAEKALRESGAAQDKDVIDHVTKLVERADAIKPVPVGLIGQLKAVQSNVAVVGGNVYGGITFGAPPPPRG
jgi:hypothetical protein